jgi:uncharacterized membrane protein
MDITNTLEIAAPVDEVWALTADIERWPAMTTTMTSVDKLDDGPVRLGSRARIKQPGMRPAVWTVTDFEPEHLFAWETKLGTVRLRAVHDLEATDDGCRNTLTVEMTGFGSGILRTVAGKRLRKAIATENAGFRRTAEAGEKSEPQDL